MEVLKNCPYTEGDSESLLVEYRTEYRGKDMKATLEYFEELKKEDPEFYYSYTLDEFDRVENLFWVDGAARRFYELYSDCLSFDTTYLTNAYNMPCAPFIGIDRNGITIQLGCGFLRNEKTKGFVWLFTKFKKAMGGKDPTNIITDQDIAMKAAIVEVFVSSVHRNCRWHIMENARKTMGAFLDSKGDGKEELADDFKDCIDNSFTPAEFEQKWQAFLDKYELNNDERFQHVYDMRHCWIPTYFMHCFFPFLQTTARSEGFNAVLKRYVNPKNSILNFVQQYKKIQQRIFSKQDLQEAATATKLSSSYYVVRVEGDDLIDVVPYKRCPDLLYGTWTFRVTSSRVEGLYSCTCCKFERDGVLCCHILKVFDALAVREVPDRYILPRWSVEPVVDSGVEVAANEPLQEAHITDHGKHVIRYSRMCTNFNKIVRPFMADDEGYGIVSKQARMLLVLR
ncbi:protein FAR1-RELATED SEQUENCE 5-like [Panicum virgatum]|uniref:protein FAR1-RELATED SEQUENCE 5-like n=1 Tax=Panicum virgatum TaxID=38727 RepID=UPI0019D58F40|nr:protein FAR1-RELATED SEQUENCE 5-like [Panicum virgatum]